MRMTAEGVKLMTYLAVYYIVVVVPVIRLYHAVLSVYFERAVETPKTKQVKAT